MPQTALPNIGLDYEWDLGADGWKTGMDDNLALLDNLAQARINFALKSVSAQPGSPNNGDAYILGANPTGTDWARSPTRENAFAVWYTNTGWHFADPREGWRVYDASQNRFWRYDGTNWVEDQIITFQLALSDLTSAITAGDDAAYMRMPFDFQLTEVRASLLTAASSSPGLTVVNIRNLSNSPVDVLSTALTIDEGELTSETAVTPAVIASPNFLADDDVRFDIDSIDTTPRGLRVTLYGFQA
jgi:hypothetical protein